MRLRDKSHLLHDAESVGDSPVLDNFPLLETADADDHRLVFELPDSVYRLAFFAFEFKRGVLDIVFFEPVLDFSFNEFNPEYVCLGRVNMGLDDVDVRAESPQMNIMDAAHSFNALDSLDDIVKADISGRVLEKNMSGIPDDRPGRNQDEPGNGHPEDRIDNHLTCEMDPNGGNQDGDR